MITMKRMWVNQPSKLQPLHYIHGKNVLVNKTEMENESKTVTIFFTTGDNISQMCIKECLVEGWKKE